MEGTEFKSARARIKVNEKTCALCQTCALFCSMGKWSEVSPEMGCMEIDIDYFNGNINFSTCYQCTAPSCVAVCKKGAIEFDEEKGCYAINRDKCVGCGMCARACPKHAISFNAKLKKAAKCDLCGTCVEVCPEHAITMVEIDKFGREKK